MRNMLWRDIDGERNEQNKNKWKFLTCNKEFPPVKTTELYNAGRISTSHIPALVAAVIKII